MSHMISRFFLGGGSTRNRSWFSHYATSRKIVGSIANFHWHIPSGRTVAQGSIQPVTEMSKSKVNPLQARGGPEGG